MAENPNEQLLLLPNPEDTRKIARALSNETSVKILESLGKKSMSAGDLEAELGVRLNTLKYNLDVLLENGLIRVRQVKWSRKGREIKVYEPTEKVIILVPGGNRAALRSVFSMFREDVPEKNHSEYII